ncbi:hypothetical protein SteCoe_3859 [Stentor coeruleus]|uniref:Uncharacterized protein n=1 Tax=Stentor coeruleus TaxID=5963 RepID=A0A1R2CW28_9CILI|nr:hypothetical protein SteCoe_3859 [Stentor coeruleus]
MSQELNWYEFETRMRRLIVELLEPTIQRITTDKEAMVKTTSKVKAIRKQIKHIETLIGSGKTKSGWMESTDNSLREFAIRLSQSEAKQEGINQRLESSLEKNSQELYRIDKKAENLISTNKDIENQIQALQNSISAQALLINTYLETNKQEFSEKYNNLIIETVTSQKKTDGINSKISEVTSKVTDFQIIIDKFRQILNELSTDVQKIDHEKANIDHMNFENSKIYEKVFHVSEKANHNADKVEEILRYLGVYLPKDMQTCVSDNLHNILEGNILMKYNDYEEKVIKILQSNPSIGESSNTEEMIKKSIESIMRVIKRNSDLKFVEEAKKFNKKAKQEQKNPALKLVSQQCEELFSSLPKTENFDVFKFDITSQLNKSVSSLNEELKKVREEIWMKNDKQEILLEMIRKECEDIKEKMFKDRQIFDKELISFSNSSSKFESSHKIFHEDIHLIKNRIKDMGECFNILNLLFSKSDESLKPIGSKEKKYEKNMSFVEHECEKFICQGTAPMPIHSSKPQYSMSLIKYKDTTYERNELLDHLGKLVKSFHTKMPSSLDLSKKKNNEFFIPVAKPRLQGSITSRKKIQGFV